MTNTFCSLSNDLITKAISTYYLPSATIMIRGKKRGNARWTAWCEADNFLTDVFYGQVLYQGRKLTDIPIQDFPPPIVVFDQYPEVFENHNSSVFKTHWNNENVARGMSISGTSAHAFKHFWGVLGRPYHDLQFFLSDTSLLCVQTRETIV